MSDNHSEAVGELDILAYVDGRLDRDPVRKAAVEAYLREHPEQAAQAEAYMLQNNAIRAAYSTVGEDAVPDRLLAVLDRDPTARMKPVLRATAAAAALALAASVGWWAGQTQTDPERPSMLTRSFVEQTMYGHFGPATANATENGQPLVSLSQRLSLELQPPDLSAFGFQQVDMRAIGGNGGNGAVRVTYADASNRNINLFLRTRWEETAPAVNFVERNGVSMAYWLDGPLVYGLAAQIGQDRLAEVAAHIRQASRPSGSSLVGTDSETPIVEHQGAMPAGTGQADDQPVPDLIVPRTPEEEIPTIDGNATTREQ